MIYLYVVLGLLLALVLSVIWSAIDDLRLADEYKCPSDGGVLGFDRAKSIEMDNSAT